MQEARTHTHTVHFISAADSVELKWSRNNLKALDLNSGSALMCAVSC